DVLHRRVALPAWVAAIVMAAAAVVGLRGLAPVLALGLGTFALAVIVRQYATAIRAQRRSGSVGWLAAPGAVVRSNPRHYGGHVVHVGVVIFALAFAMSSAFSTDREVSLDEGESARLAGYRVTYQGVASSQEGDRDVT